MASLYAAAEPACNSTSIATDARSTFMYAISMHIFFSGIGGGAIGPLALIAKQTGYHVSGSDQKASSYTEQLQAEGITLHIGQTTEAIAAVHAKKPIDWLVFSSAITRANTHHPEIEFAKTHHIRHSLRDELLNKILTDKHLPLIGIAGTHGKSTTTAMVMWLLHQLSVPFGHSIGAKVPFAPMGQLPPDSQFFVYECDEYDYNFLQFHPAVALITGISWDHHEIFPTAAAYKKAFQTFIDQSEHTFIWRPDAEHIGQNARQNITILSDNDPAIASLELVGTVNRRNAWLAIQAVHFATGQPLHKLVPLITNFPGLKQRMEKLAPNLYTNYAHTPEKIQAGLQVATEIASVAHQKVVIIYEPLTNRRQYYIKEQYADCFSGADKIYWVPTYLAREDPTQAILSPQGLIAYLKDPSIAETAELDDELVNVIKKHLDAGDIVVAVGASGAGSLDEWLRGHLEDFQN